MILWLDFTGVSCLCFREGCLSEFKDFPSLTTCAIGIEMFTFLPEEVFDDVLRHKPSPSLKGCKHLGGSRHQQCVCNDLVGCHCATFGVDGFSNQLCAAATLGIFVDFSDDIFGTSCPRGWHCDDLCWGF